MNGDFIQPAITAMEFSDESLLGLCVPGEEPRTTLEAPQFHTRFLPLSRGAQEREGKATTSFVLPLASSCVSLRIASKATKNRHALSKFPEAHSFPTGLVLSILA